jgi:hypothetical protein
LSRRILIDPRSGDPACDAIFEDAPDDRIAIAPHHRIRAVANRFLGKECRVGAAENSRRALLFGLSSDAVRLTDVVGKCAYADDVAGVDQARIEPLDRLIDDLQFDVHAPGNRPRKRCLSRRHHKGGACRNT